MLSKPDIECSLCLSNVNCAVVFARNLIHYGSSFLSPGMRVFTFTSLSYGLHGFESRLDPKGGAYSFHPLAEASDIGQVRKFWWLHTGRLYKGQGGCVWLMGKCLFARSSGKLLAWKMFCRCLSPRCGWPCPAYI